MSGVLRCLLSGISGSGWSLTALLLLSRVTCAGVGDVTIRTDHPQYAGEGAFQTVEDCVRFATDGIASEQDKAIALYLWLLTHQWHLASPQEFLVPGLEPDTQRSNQYDAMVYDANKGRFSYGYGLCGTVHAWNEPYWKALGMNARRRAFPGHTNSEIEYGGGWHAFDTDMAGLIFRRDGVVAGYEDVIADPDITANARPPLPCYPFAWPGDFETMQKGWREVAAGGHWYKMYHSGYAAQPGIVHLRSGETFTRYFDRDHFGGPSKRRFWHHLAGGPYRDWTFANQGTPQHDGDTSNSRGHASYCNGVFVYRPDLSSDSILDGVVARSDSVTWSGESPRLRSREEPGWIVLEHFSPYVICGDPQDDANPMTGRATDGLVISGRAVGEVTLSLSVDCGQSWREVGRLADDFHKDLTDIAKGHYGWQARLEFPPGAGLDDLTFSTTTQVCQSIYPRLTPGGSQVTWRAASRAVVPAVPNLALVSAGDPAGGPPMEVTELRSSNVKSQPRSARSRFAWTTTNNRPGEVVFRVESPSDLVELVAAAHYGVRVPPPPDTDFRLEVSIDEGATWRPVAHAQIPGDNEYSSGWMWGRTAIGTDGVRRALVKVRFYNGGYTAGISRVEIYGIRKTSPPEAATLTYGWFEGNRRRTASFEVPSGTEEVTWTVPTGGDIRDDFIRIAVP